MIFAHKPYVLCFLGLFFLSPSVSAQPCHKIHDFEGLIFDGGAFPAPEAMEKRLDFALSQGVTKVVLFPHPTAQGPNASRTLKKVFPDLVVRGTDPWSKVSGIVWPEPLSSDDLSDLEDDLMAFPDRNFLLGHLSRFDLKLLLKLVQSNKNLWLGLNDDDVTLLLKTCGQGELGKLLQTARERVVYTSFGLKDGWANYKWQIARLKELSSLLPIDEADGLVFRNAEELYGLAVNAP
jgi:hypothetical protein